MNMITKTLNIFTGVILLTIGTVYSALATHNRAGEITYKQTGSNTIEATITTYTKISGQSIHADRDELTIDWGDGKIDIVPRTTKVDIYNDIRRNTYVAIHTYPGPSPAPGQPYILSMQDPNRNNNILNINGGNSVNTPFYIQTEVFLFSAATYGNNSSPILLEPPIDFGVIGQVFQHTPNAYDPDGDSIAYELITPLQDKNGITVPGYQLVSDISPGPDNSYAFDVYTGLFTWTYPQQAGEYNIAILVKSYRNGQYLGGIVRDIQIEIRNEQNTPPKLNAPTEICVEAGKLIEFEVTTFDSDIPVQLVTLTGTGGPLFDPNIPSPATFSNVVGNPDSSTFSWQTVCDHIQEQPYQLVFKARDEYIRNGVDASLATFKVVRITVTAPAPDSLEAEVNNGTVELRWKAPYECSSALGFFGFTVWRKEVCDAFIPDSCEVGLAGRGYTRINPTLIKTPNGNYYTYTDSDIERGGVYSYRVLAEFGTPVYNNGAIVNYHSPVSSKASNEACIKMSQDLPILTNVDVDSTSPTTGIVFVQWSRPNPEELDTIQNPPPYQYALYRSDDMNGGNFGVLPVFTSPIYNAFYLANDTSFIDTDLNTAGTPYSYKVRFFAANDTIGDTEPSSSIFLKVAATDKKIILSWTEKVSWTNQRYVVYLESPKGSANYIVLDTVNTQNYTHTGLTNGEEYCYYVKSIGTYGIVNLLDPLLNKSQRACGIPLDTVAPCPPSKVEISSSATVQGCINVGDRTPMDALNNTISWSRNVSGQNNCDNDVAKYRVYFAPYCNGDYQLLAESADLGDSLFIHQPSTTNLAGCYYVTTVDSIQSNGGGNESKPSAIIQTDNCPIYNLPNVFTPNGDERNDLYTPFMPYRYIQEVQFQVTNRWGQVVFETTDPAINWDGRNMNTGQPLAEAVYFYTCLVTEDKLVGAQQIQLKGYIHIIRGK